MINKHRIKEEIESQILHWRQNYDLYGKEVDAAKVIGATWIYDLIRPLLDNDLDILDTSAVPISCFKFIRTLVEQRCVCDNKLSVMHLNENHITVVTAISAFMIK
jgi:hypothetical protein